MADPVLIWIRLNIVRRQETPFHDSHYWPQGDIRDADCGHPQPASQCDSKQRENNSLHLVERATDMMYQSPALFQRATRVVPPSS